MTFLNTLQAWQWAVFAAIPVAIVALYFLKLRRELVLVPSTYLWARAIEDLHVNSLWQRLRRSLLLLLQLLLVGLLMAACFRPSWRGSELVGQRFVFLVDTSASMSATDVSPNRLEVAKKKLLDLIGQMKSGDAALLVTFSDVARVEQPFTSNRGLLREKVRRIRPSQRRSDLQEALRVAAGLANPGRIGEDVGDVRTAGALPATLYILSDGGFPPIANFALGNLTPVYIAVGSPRPDNVGVMAFSVERNPAKPGQLEAFARFENSGEEEVSSDVTLSVDGRLADAGRLVLSKKSEGAIRFDLGNIEEGVLKIDWQRSDQLNLDNSASVVFGIPRRARVLLVTPGNESLRLALSTPEARKIADVTAVGSDYLGTNDYRDAAAGNAYDVILFDRCVPPVMPACNTFFVGDVPPDGRWTRGTRQPLPFILDNDRAHPLTYLVDMSSVRFIYDGFPVHGPEGSRSLCDGSTGPLIVIAQRGGYEDVAMGFELVGDNSKGEVIPKTDWPGRSSFPVFVMNVLTYLGGLQGTANSLNVQPGAPANLRLRTKLDQITVESPSREVTELPRNGQNAFAFSGTDEIGIYKVFEGTSRTPSQRFAVNLMDSRESNLAPRDRLELGFESVPAKSSGEPTRRELWKLLLLIGLGVLMFEWYVFNRRVFL